MIWLLDIVFPYYLYKSRYEYINKVSHKPKDLLLDPLFQLLMLAWDSEMFNILISGIEAVIHECMNSVLKFLFTVYISYLTILSYLRSIVKVVGLSNLS